MNTQGIGGSQGGRVPLEYHKHIPGHEPGHKGKLLQPIEVIHPNSITALLAVGPEAELRLGSFLPLLGSLWREAQHIPVDGTFQRQPNTDHLGAVCVDCTCSQRGGHIKHPAPLAHGPIVIVNIFVRCAALWPKALHRSAG